MSQMTPSVTIIRQPKRPLTVQSPSLIGIQGSPLQRLEQLLSLPIRFGARTTTQTSSQRYTHKQDTQNGDSKATKAVLVYGFQPRRQVMDHVASS